MSISTRAADGGRRRQLAGLSFLRSAQLGDELVAEAVERVLAGRTGIYDVTVRTAAGEPVAEFRGRSRATPHLRISVG